MTLPAPNARESHRTHNRSGPHPLNAAVDVRWRRRVYARAMPAASAYLSGATLVALGGVVIPHVGLSLGDEPVCVDAGFWVEFVLADGSQERWDSGIAYCDIGLQPGAGPLAAQLEGQARAAGGDIVAEMRGCGYDGEGDVASLPLSWAVDSRLLGESAAGDRDAASTV
jgi:hypothetical protein